MCAGEQAKAQLAVGKAATVPPPRHLKRKVAEVSSMGAAAGQDLRMLLPFDSFASQHSDDWHIAAGGTSSKPAAQQIHIDVFAGIQPQQDLPGVVIMDHRPEQLMQATADCAGPSASVSQHTGAQGAGAQGSIVSGRLSIGGEVMPAWQGRLNGCPAQPGELCLIRTGSSYVFCCLWQ